MNIGDLAVDLLPSIGVGWLFFIVMRGIIRADRREREAIAQMDREEVQRARNLLAEQGDPPVE